MIKPDDIMLSSAEFMALVEKYEAEAVKDYKKSTPETREHYIIIEVPLHKSICKKSFIDDLKVKYIENGWREVTAQYNQDDPTTLIIILWI